MIWGDIKFDCVKAVFAEVVWPQHLLSGLMCKYEWEEKPEAPEKPGIINVTCVIFTCILPYIGNIFANRECSNVSDIA